MDFETMVKASYPYLSDCDAKRIVNKAKMFYYSLAYPADKSIDEDTLPIKGFRAEQWVLSACDELVERLGFSNAIAYRENGVSWTFDNAHLSDRLVSMIMPQAGVIGK